MSPKKAKGNNVGRWIVTLLLLSAATWFWFNRQWVIDTITVSRYMPSADIQTVASRSKLTDNGKFYFYASQPQVDTSKSFNSNCGRKEANSPILGCYSAMRIYIYDVTDERLDGIEEVTAAHEMLHAVYDRLSRQEKDHLAPLLHAAYKRVKTAELTKRMAYYNRAEPGESDNELHSILGTEFSNLGGELNTYYQRYFSDRLAVVKLHEKVQKTFDELTIEADTLVLRANTLAATINRTTDQYNSETKQLNLDIQSFNKRASQTGGFTTQSEFNDARTELADRSEQLANNRRVIVANITVYNNLIAQLDSVTAETASLNRSLDSTLTDAPTL